MSSIPTQSSGIGEISTKSSTDKDKMGNIEKGNATVHRLFES